MAAPGSPAGRPRNLLFLWTDEQRPDTLGVYHDHSARAPRAPTASRSLLRGRTPHLDRLAAGGVVFERAYCAEPLCTPSRATVLTGLYPHAHGALHNNVPLPDSAPTLAELLAPAGYRCGYAGKWHLGDELRPQRGFGWWSSTEDQYVHDHRAHGFSSYHRWLVSQGHQPPDRAADGSRIWSRESAARLPEHLGKPAFLAREACRFLDEHQAAHPGAPFVLSVNFLEPHMPFCGPWDDLFPPDDVRLPETWGTAPDSGMPLRYRLRRDGFAARNPHVSTDDAAGWRALAARYWGLASLVDAYAGRILDHLEALGLADSTVVVYSTDHGEMMGEHRLLAKAMPYEASAQVPLILRAPDVSPRRVAAPVSQVDLVPTLLELLGQPLPDRLQGRSLLPVLGQSAEGREGEASAPVSGRDVVIEWSGVPRGGAVSGYRPPQAGAPSDGSPEAETVLRAMAARLRTIRSGQWKLTVDEFGEHELYDLEADPLETRNLLFARRLQANGSAGAAVGPLWRRLQEWQRRTADPVTLPAPEPWGE
jgi:arylsulfatase A-like enzyme